MDRYLDLEGLHRDCLDCQLCSLRHTATQVVPGEGNSTADIMFIGEGPGKREDVLGRPFVGPAGKFLDILLDSIQLKREDVFIANMVKCRPPNNRDPLDDEKDACRPWLDEQIRLISPKIFVPLGRHALHKFVADIQISKAHGKFFRSTHENYKDRIIFAMYHPAVALYNGGMRPKLIEDMQNLRKFLDGVKQEVVNYEEEVSDRVKEVRQIMKDRELNEESGQDSGQISLF